MSQEAEDAFDDIRLDFAAEAGVGEGRMFSTEGLTYRGKFFVALTGDQTSLLVKLPEARVTELIEEGTGRPFRTGDRAPMREWALIPLDAVDRWQAIAAEAFAFAKAAVGPVEDDDADATTLDTGAGPGADADDTGAGATGRNDLVDAEGSRP
ncbi:MAG TPA: hypothetical protein VIL36_02670 [Acidimicrobiales bacterium]